MFATGGRRIQWNNKSQRSEYSISVGGRFQVAAKGQVENTDLMIDMSGGKPDPGKLDGLLD